MPETQELVRDIVKDLPGLDCGICGQRTCEEFAHVLVAHPEERKRCTSLSANVPTAARPRGECAPAAVCSACNMAELTEEVGWKDSLDREFDFVLDTFANEPGPIRNSPRS